MTLLGALLFFYKFFVYIFFPGAAPHPVTIGIGNYIDRVLTMPIASMAKSTVPKKSGMLLTVPTGSRPSNEGASRKM